MSAASFIRCIGYGKCPRQEAPWTDIKIWSYSSCVQLIHPNMSNCLLRHDKIRSQKESTPNTQNWLTGLWMGLCWLYWQTSRTTLQTVFHLPSRRHIVPPPSRDIWGIEKTVSYLLSCFFILVHTLSHFFVLCLGMSCSHAHVFHTFSYVFIPFQTCSYLFSHVVVLCHTFSYFVVLCLGMFCSHAHVSHTFSCLLSCLFSHFLVLVGTLLCSVNLREPSWTFVNLHEPSLTSLRTFSY